MNITSIASEYLNSAEAIKTRVDELKDILKSKKYTEQKKLEDRIVILNAEYSHLIRIANHLGTYYHKAKPVSRIGVMSN